MKKLTLAEFRALPVAEEVAYVDSLAMEERWDDLEAEGYKYLCKKLDVHIEGYDRPEDLLDGMKVALMMDYNQYIWKGKVVKRVPGVEEETYKGQTIYKAYAVDKEGNRYLVQHSLFKENCQFGKRGSRYGYYGW